MKILVGNDWRSTAAGYASSAGQISLLITGFLAVVAQNDPKHNWLWTIISAGVVCALGIFRIVIGQIQNYVSSDPNITKLSTPAIVNVSTTGPVPAAPVPPQVAATTK